MTQQHADPYDFIANNGAGEVHVYNIDGDSEIIFRGKERDCDNLVNIVTRNLATWPGFKPTPAAGEAEYSCLECPFETDSEDEINEHIDAEHNEGYGGN